MTTKTNGTNASRIRVKFSETLFITARQNETRFSATVVSSIDCLPVNDYALVFNTGAIKCYPRRLRIVSGFGGFRKSHTNCLPSIRDREEDGAFGITKPASAGGGSRDYPACAWELFIKADGYGKRRGLSRVCVGTLPASRRGVEGEGTIPRVRGNSAGTRGRVSTSWGYPACAGELCFAVTLAVDLRVYPCVCRGTGHAGRGAADAGGISPRERGCAR